MTNSQQLRRLEVRDVRVLEPGGEGSGSGRGEVCRCHQAPSGVVITPSPDGVGVFVYRDADGRGPLALRGVRVRTTLPCDGQAFKIWVGALAMVRVPTSSFFVGDPLGAKGPSSCLYRAKSPDAERQAYPIDSEDEIAVGSEAGQLGEYAWGSTTLVQSVVILGDESGRPIVQGNCNIGNPMQLFQGGDGGQGPVPDDAFRASRYQDHAEAIHRVPESEQTFTAREETGASYYGIMGLSGNLWEFVVSLGTDKGRSYVGEHGNGNLDAAAGPELETTWPTPDNQGVGFRGGSWYTKTSSGRIADRCFGSGLIGYAERSHDTGVRGVRTAPEEP